MKHKKTQESWKNFWNDTQVNVGKYDAMISLIGSCFIGVIMIIIGCVLLFEGYKSKNENEKPIAYVVGLTFILIAILSILAAFFWNKAVNKSKTVAQIGGFLFETRLLNNLVNSSNSSSNFNSN